MPGEPVQYEYVGIEDLAMRFAYDRVKEAYLHRNWNLKTTPCAVLMREREVLAWALAADGRHAIEGTCARLWSKGTDYSTCKWCAEDQHAEQIALRRLKEQNIVRKPTHLYLYGHWRMCDSCILAASSAGVEHFVLLKNATELFDRHHKNTVIGKPRQFEL